MNHKLLSVAVVLFIFFLLAVMLSFVVFDFEELNITGSLEEALGVGEQSAKPSGETKDMGETHQLEGIMTNLGGTLDPIQVSLALEIYPGSGVEELEEKDPLLRDRITMIIRDKSAEDFEGEALEKLKTEMIIELNDHLTDTHVNKIHFIEIISPSKEK